MSKKPMDISSNHQNSGEQESIGFMIFGFFDQNDALDSEGSCNSTEISDRDIFFDDEEDENSHNVEEGKAFWESQEKLLEATLCRTSSFESKVRQATKDVLQDLRTKGVICVCRRPVAVANTCRSCLRREVFVRIQNAGYDCTMCKSKWNSSSEIPSGEHAYLEVKGNTSSKKFETRIVIELNFRAEFEMARAGKEYNYLIRRLPEIYIGKFERLRTVIKILCSAAKKCMRDRKMHIAPWRKEKYMQAKWRGNGEVKSLVPIFVHKTLKHQQKQRVSMLTSDLLENLPSSNHMTVKVV